MLKNTGWDHLGDRTGERTTHRLRTLHWKTLVEQCSHVIFVTNKMQRQLTSNSDLERKWLHFATALIESDRGLSSDTQGRAL
jgi:hypothetical protein